MAVIETEGRIEDLVHVEQAATVLSSTRRTVDRLIASGELERHVGEDGRTYVTKTSLLAAREAREGGAPRSTSQSQQMATQLSAVVDRLTALADTQQRQLTIASEEAKQALMTNARLEERLKSREERIFDLEAQLALNSRRRWWRRQAPPPVSDLRVVGEA